VQPPSLFAKGEQVLGDYFNVLHLVTWLRCTTAHVSAFKTTKLPDHFKLKIEVEEIIS